LLNNYHELIKIPFSFPIIFHNKNLLFYFRFF
jgi:hypothetical protein